MPINSGFYTKNWSDSIMKKMPYEIKQKLRQYANLQIKVAQMAKEIDEMIEEYGVPIENLIAMGNIYSDEPQTEALAFLHNCECDNIEGTIKEIEKVFLYFANKKTEEK